MGIILAQTIVDEVEEELQDIDHEVWAENDHLVALNDAQREIVWYVPGSNVTTSNKLCSVSTAKQSIPTTAIRLLFPYATTNMGTDGSTPGTAITPVNIAEMNLVYPSWRTATGSATTQHIMYDEKADRNVFYTYPPQPASSPGYIELIYDERPSDILIGAAITLDDCYKEAIKHFMKYRAYSWNYEGDPTHKAQADKYLNLFYTSIGRQDQIEKGQR